MSEKLCMVPLRHELLNGRNAGSKNSTPEDSGLCSQPSAARSLAPRRRVAVYIISRPTATACAIPSSTLKACVLPPAWSRPDARLPLARASNAPVCTGPFQAPMPSSLSAAQNSVVVFKTSGSADQNAGPHDPSLSWGAPPRRGGAVFSGSEIDQRDCCLRRLVVGRIWPCDLGRLARAL